MRQLTWPQAFALVFGGLPAFVFTLAAVATSPGVGWPVIALALAGYGLHRRARTRAALAARADATLAAYAGLVAAPLPDLPAEPMRPPGNSVASIRRPR